MIGSVALCTLGGLATVTGSKFREFGAPNQSRKIFASRDSVTRVDYPSGKEILGVLNRIWGPFSAEIQNGVILPMLSVRCELRS